METLVYVEDEAGEPTLESLALLSRAAELGGAVTAVVCGSVTAERAAGLGEYGATRAVVADHPALRSSLAQPRVDVLARLYERRRFDSLLFATSTLTADVAGGLAARLEAGLNWDLVSLERRGESLAGTRLALNDSAVVEVTWRRKPELGLVRPGVFEPVRRPGAAEAELERVEVALAEWSAGSAVVEYRPVAAEEQPLEEAGVIVTAGRGLGERENLALVEALAAALGGVVGTTMPLVDRGWCPHSIQVGLTGKRVRPRLYIACGVSGAIQHKVGMDRSGTIVAINTDPNAPIFRFCDLGVIGDVLEVVPALTELIRERRAKTDADRGSPIS